MKRAPALFRVAFLPALLLVAACEDEATAPTEPEFQEGVISMDASSPFSYVYVSLDQGRIVNVGDPSTSTESDSD